MVKKIIKNNLKTQKQKRSFAIQATNKLLFISSSLFVLLFGLFYYTILYQLPTPYALKENRSPQTTIIRDREQRVLYRIYENENRINLDFADIPDVVKNATIAIEDSNFYHHPGISIKSIFRALLSNIKENNKNYYQGGSTITQQLVKNKLLTPKKSYRRKLKEIVLALWTERVYSKEDILTMYLNEICYGGSSYGIEAAAWTYFNKHAQNLTLAEAAYLSGLPVSPTTFSIFGANPDLVKNRQSLVLEKMLKLSMINQEQFDQASSENLVFAKQKIDILAPHFVMFVKNMLVDKFGETETTHGGLEVVTTLDLDIQMKAEEIVQKQINSIKDSYNIHNAGVLVTDPGSGEILAMVGSVDYFDLSNDGNVNVTTSLRQPGSAIKPVNYSYAFDHGFTPASMIEDAPVSYKVLGAKNYIPVNYDGKFHGNVTLRSALANSYNIPAVKVLNRYGVDKMLDLGERMGIKSWNNSASIGLSLTLGGLEVTMLDMARVYGIFANSGKSKELKSIAVIRDGKNKDITSRFYQNENEISLIKQAEASQVDNPQIYPPLPAYWVTDILSNNNAKKQVFGPYFKLTLSEYKENSLLKQAEASQIYNPQIISPLSAYWVTDILSDNQARQNAFGIYSKLTIPKYKVAVKTGTSNNFRDNWTIGFTPNYLVAVWVGNNDGSLMNKRLVSGITGAAPIWNEIMTGLLAESTPQEFAKPEGLIPVKICAFNGLLTCPNCPEEKTEYFMSDKVPTKQCFFRPIEECEEAKKQAEGKNEAERKTLLTDCALPWKLDELN